MDLGKREAMSKRTGRSGKRGNEVRLLCVREE